MWQNPELVFEALKADEAYDLFRMGLGWLPFDNSDTHSMGGVFLKTVYELCQDQYKETSSLEATESQITFNQSYRGILFGAVKAISEENDYAMVCALRSMQYSMNFGLGWPCDRSKIDKSQLNKWLMQIFVNKTVGIIHWLAGNESQILVGCYNGEAAWLDLEKPIESVQEINRIKLPSPNEMFVISSADLDLVRACLRDQPVTKDVPRIRSLRSVIDLLEDTYANTHFTIDPDGARVLITGLPHIQAITLKVKQPDERTLQILAKIDHDKGSMLFGIYDIMEILEFAQEGLARLPTVAFLLYLVIQIYHDLVTTKQIRVARKRNVRATPTTKKRKHHRMQDYHPSFIYIPRVIQEQERQPRYPLPKAIREYTPRHVRGHYRHMPMTEKHKQEILEFEQTFDIQVLVYLQDGYTYVRPHISPAITPEEFHRLPTYIKARIQDDIRLVLEGLPTEE